MITIAERLKPFSHVPGTSCLLPGTEYLVECFPTLIRIKNFSGQVIKEVTLDLQGPLREFTLMQDLERGCITLFSEFYRFHILPNLEVVFQKNPPLPPLKVEERLSLGSHKKQDWESIKKRCDFHEIFPLWLRLGSLLNLPPREGDDRGVFSLLKKVREASYAHHPEGILPAFEQLFRAAFGKMFVPRASDEDHQGILTSTEKSDDSPLYLLTEGAEIIRSLFFLASENEFSLLPNLPPEFSEGRMLHLNCSLYGKANLEWSKKMIKKVHFKAEREGEIIFHFPPDIRRFRLREALQEKGIFLAAGESLEIKSGCHYLLDQFQK